MNHPSRRMWPFQRKQPSWPILDNHLMIVSNAPHLHDLLVADEGRLAHVRPLRAFDEVSPSDSRQGTCIAFAPNSTLGIFFDYQAVFKSSFDRIISASRRGRAHITVGGYSRDAGWSLLAVVAMGRVEKLFWWDRNTMRYPCDEGPLMQSEDTVRLSKEDGSGIDAAMRDCHPDLQALVMKCSKTLCLWKDSPDQLMEQYADLVHALEYTENSFIEARVQRMAQRVRKHELQIDQCWTKLPASGPPRN